MCYLQEIREGMKLDLLVAEMGDISCGGLEIMMKRRGWNFSERTTLQKSPRNMKKK